MNAAREKNTARSVGGRVDRRRRRSLCAKLHELGNGCALEHEGRIVFQGPQEECRRRADELGLLVLLRAVVGDRVVWVTIPRD